MNIHYDLKTLRVLAVFYQVAPVTHEWHLTQPDFAFHDEKIALDSIHLSPHPTEPGKVVVSEKQHHEATVSSLSVKAGQSILIDNVSEGSEVRSNYEHLGVMDDSGSLEFTPETAGFYKLQLLKPGFHIQEFNLEALA